MGGAILGAIIINVQTPNLRQASDRYINVLLQ
jgi:hypothetical protein